MDVLATVTEMLGMFERLSVRAQIDPINAVIVYVSVGLFLASAIFTMAMAINYFAADERLSLRDRTWLRLARVRIQNDRTQVDYLAMQRAFMAKSKI